MQKIILELDSSIFDKVLWFLKQLPKNKVKLTTEEYDDTIMTNEDIEAYNIAQKEFEDGDTYTLEDAKKELLQMLRITILKIFRSLVK